MNSLPVISGRLAGFLEDFAKSPVERRTVDPRVRPSLPDRASDRSTDHEPSRDLATVQGGALASASEQASSPDPAPTLRGHLVDRLV